MLRFKLPKSFGKHALVVLNSLSLIDDHKIIIDFAKNLLLTENHLISREQNVKVASVQLGHFNIFSILDVAIEHEHSCPRKPFVELPVPFIYRNFRGDNYMMVVTR